MHAAMVAVVLATAAAGGEQRLFGFERDEVGRLGGRFDRDTADAYQIHHGFGGATGDTTEGKWALRRTLHDRYGFLKPGNKTSYYIRHRTGCVLNARRGVAFPADWSAHDVLRVDVKGDTIGFKVLLELEDDYIPDPVTRTFTVPAGTWVTLETDLHRAAADRGLDLKRVAALRLIITETSARVGRAVVRLDNLRLAKAEAKADLPVLRDATPMKAPVRKPGPVNALEPLDTSAQKPLSGTVGVIDFTKKARWRKPSYAIFKAKERLLGGFGASGVLVVPGANRAYLSLDGGLTWSGLEGKPGGTALSGGIRGHRATVLVDGRDIYIATIPYHCAGGGGRTEVHFNRCLYRDGRWTVGPLVVFETGVRHCADRLSLVKLASGRLWVAWDHLGRIGGYSIRAKFSDDGGLTWGHAGRNGLVGTPGGGIPSGPYLAAWRDHVACVWRHRETMFWSAFDGKTWGPAVAVRRKSVPFSVVAAGGSLYTATHRPDAVLRFDGTAWTDDAPPIKTGLLSRCGETLVCVGSVKGDAGSRIVLCRKPAGREWGEPQTVAVEAEKLEGLAVPQISPSGEDGAFVPVAFSSVSRRWIKVISVPLGSKGGGS